MDEFVRFPGPCEPIRVEDYIPVYSSDQIEIFGEPEHWGICSYLVVQTRESAAPMVMDYDMEQERRGSIRPPHHYSRIERFESTLYQLIACRGKVPRDVIAHIKEVGYNKDPDHVWDSIRDILKKKNWRIYYNRIPTILQILGFKRKIDFGDSNSLVRDIVHDFVCISYKFDQIKDGMVGRKYFPSIRFVAFKLLLKHGAEFQYRIPFARTPRKLVILEEIWKLIDVD